MRKIFGRMLAVLAVLALCASPALAVDKILNDKIQSATVAIDKNGNQYVRFIVNETKKLEGVEYQSGTVVVAFGELAKQAKSYKAGDSIKAIVAGREYQGNMSYTVRAFIPNK